MMKDPFCLYCLRIELCYFTVIFMRLLKGFWLEMLMNITVRS